MIDKCFLCGSDKYHIIHEGVRNVPEINVLKCDCCGLVRLSECVDDEYYKESKMRQNEHETNIRQIRITAENDDLRRYRFIKNLIQNKRYLDFGCGAGGVLKYAFSETSEALGIELEERMCQQLNKEGIKCFENIDDALENIKEKVDVISLFHVLEHLPDPIGILCKLKQLLNHDGVMIIEVPNADDALLSLYNCKDFADFTYWESHIYLYNRETFRKLMEKAGLKVKFLEQIQRYPLSNTLYWLSKGLPGGHKQWSMLSDDALDKQYERQLANLGIADTIIAMIEL